MITEHLAAAFGGSCEIMPGTEFSYTLSLTSSETRLFWEVTTASGKSYRFTTGQDVPERSQSSNVNLLVFLWLLALSGDSICPGISVGLRL